MKFAQKLKLIYVLCVVGLALGGSMVTVVPEAISQETDQPEELSTVTVQPPREESRRISGSTGQSSDGFGYDQSIPSGMPFSDYSLTPSEVVSATRTTSNIATVHSAISVVENRGIGAVGNVALPDMLQRVPGVWTSSFSGAPFDSQIVIRGYSNEAVNRVSLLVDGRPLNIPRQETNTNIFFPEIIERVEVMRGDGNVQFGNKAIGGAVNVILKKPRQHPGAYFGVEAGSWHTTREWAGVNFVKGPLAAGVFMGRYYQEGWRVWDGNGIDDEPVHRPGPWVINNFTGSLNWKITPRLTFDIMLTRSDSRGPNPSIPLNISQERFERRDTRNVENYANSWGSEYYYVSGSGPEEKWDNVSLGKLLYDGDWLGNLEIIGSWRSYDRRNIFDSAAWPWYTNASANMLWQDFGLSFKYDRSDRWSFIRNDLTVGSDLLDGRFRREVAAAGVHSQFQGGYRESISYYAIDTLRLWDRVILGLGYRTENYDMKNLYANRADRTPTFANSHYGQPKSASQWSVGLVYDRELGSSLYYKHSRLYRFPNFDDMVNQFSGPPYFWELEPEEGTLEEWAIRHWLTKNIYLGATYYEMYMDSEILYGNPTGLSSQNFNVRDVSHHGVELELLCRITPRWTVRGSYTRQKIISRSQYLAGGTDSTEDKWLWQNPADLGNLAVDYQNNDWGFAAMISYNYVGRRWRINDPYNSWPDLESARWGDISMSQDVFDGLGTIYFGIKNFTDSSYAILGTKEAPPYDDPPNLGVWPNAGRTYYGGVKAAMDFQKMRLPNTADLERMNRRLYGVIGNGRDAFSGMGSWMRNMVRF